MVRKILSFLLVSVVLISTTGFVLATHICLAGSERTVSLFQENNCCEEEGTPCQESESSEQHLAAKCCVTEFSYHKADASATVFEKDSKNTVPFLVVSLSILPDDVSSVFSIPQPPPSVPSASGRKLLISIHRLLV